MESAVAISLDALGLAHLSLQNFEKASLVINQAYALRQKFLGNDHADIPRSLANLGFLNHRLGKYEESKQFYKQAIDLEKKLLGDHPCIARTLCMLGSVYETMHHYKEAKECYAQALDIRKKALEENHPDTIRVINQLGLMEEKIHQQEKERKEECRLF